jgi:serine/threonine protein kinase/Tfp pilus assembly protein PilF
MDQTAIDPRLRIREPLGTGGTARVVGACHTELKRFVAVKQWRPDGGPSQAEFGELVAREYDLIGRCRFPGLVRIVEPPIPKYHQLLLEYCPGPTLDQIERPPDATTALNIISALALDLEFLRRMGLVHSDLKPQNVFLPRNWSELGQGRLAYVKLSDFSLGCRIEDGTDHRLGLGTIGYMAPETIADGIITHHSDLFALGVIAYQLLSGIHPFLNEDADPTKVNSHVREQEPVNLSELRPDLTPDQVSVVTQLLSKDPAARPDSAWATCVALERAGATYPFRRAWRPAHLFAAGQEYDAYRDDYLTLKDHESARLQQLTDGDPAALRLVLTANFTTGRLVYDGDRFQFTKNIYWPHRSRAKVLRSYSTASFAERRGALIAACVGGRKEVTRLRVAGKYDLSIASDALTALLRPLLKVTTLKDTAARYAPDADRLDRHELATHLYLQAGNLIQAERCADLAARALSRTNENHAALSLLHTLDLRAQSADREFECRQALLLSGNICKEIGELDQAEAVYDRIIGLYENRPVDKLLAETFKNLGEVFRLRQDSPAALAALERSLSVFRDLNDELEISHTLVNIGNVHGSISEMKLALVNYRAAYKIQKRLDAKADLASTLNNIATIYCLDGRLKRGTFLLEHTLKLKKEIGHQGEIARTLNNLGYIYQITGQPARAADYLTESLEINRRIGSKKEILYNLENLVALQISAGHIKHSRDLTEEGLTLAANHSLTAHEAQFHVCAATIAKRTACYGESARSLARAETLAPDLNDPILELSAATQRAGLRYHLGDNVSALELTRSVLTRARETNNAVAELDALLLAVRLCGDKKYYSAADAIIDERRLIRERRLLAFGRIEYLLEANETEAAIEVADGLIDQLSEIEEDLELAWMESVAGRVCLEQEQTERADRHLSRALKAAQNSGLLPELIMIQVLRGRSAKIQGYYELAFRCLKQALQAGRTAANSITDAGDRQSYQRKPVMQTLASEISTLKVRLDNKQRAGR